MARGTSRPVAAPIVTDVASPAIAMPAHTRMSSARMRRRSPRRAHRHRQARIAARGSSLLAFRFRLLASRPALLLAPLRDARMIAREQLLGHADAAELARRRIARMIEALAFRREAVLDGA